MSNDWRNRWRQSRWVTIADFPLLTLDINPETYEGGHPDAGRRGDELLKQAFSTEADRIGIKLRMRIQHGYPLHKARHLVRISCQPGEYRPDDMDREVFMRDAIAFAVDEGWAVPGWLRSLIVDAPSSVASPITSNQSAGEQGAQEYTGYLLAPTASRVLTEQPARSDADPAPEEAYQDTTSQPRDYVQELAELFDPVGKAQLEAMFPDGGRWSVHTERQARKGLKAAAWVKRGKFNPFLAARWWMDTQSPDGWTWERCLRKLANNLPSRSRDLKHLLTDNFD